MIENYIKDECNLIDKESNCILHNFFMDINKGEVIIIVNVLSFILNCNDFKHINLRNNKNFFFKFFTQK